MLARQERGPNVPSSASDAGGDHGVKVSVVVPVYNPGEYLERCVASILAQTLAADEYEAIFVDDGSTDGSPARLDELASLHPNIRVIHQENSGWPGKPRNVGIDAARGEYVFFQDNDDELAPEALERLYDFAKQNGSDLVIGKMAGHGRTVPKDLFLESKPRASLRDTPLLESLTPHKLVRRSFIERHNLRFPEGRRRLEDHVFVVRAYFLADVVSIYADYVCYYHYRRGDLSNAGLRRLDPAGYYGNLREVIGIVEAHTEPGPFRDRLLERFTRAELLGRLRGKGFLEQPEEYREALFGEIRGVILDHIGDGVDRYLSPANRTPLALVRAGRRDLVEELARAELPVRAKAGVTRVRATRDGRLELTVEARLSRGDDDLAFDGLPEGPGLPVPASVAAAVPAAVRTLSGPLDGRARIVLRRRDNSAELVPASTVEKHLDTRVDGTSSLRFTLTAAIDPTGVVGTQAMWPGTWFVLTRIDEAGYSRERKVVADGTVATMTPQRVRRGGLVATTAWTKKGELTIAVKRRASLARELFRDVVPTPVRRALRDAYRRIRKPPASSQPGRGTRYEKPRRSTPAGSPRA
jgi:poly(ribitol-phosphate) beta-N-acetylglucosaminyltransferase